MKNLFKLASEKNNFAEFVFKDIPEGAKPKASQKESMEYLEKLASPRTSLSLLELDKDILQNNTLKKEKISEKGGYLYGSLCKLLMGESFSVINKNKEKRKMVYQALKTLEKNGLKVNSFQSGDEVGIEGNKVVIYRKAGKVEKYVFESVSEVKTAESAEAESFDSIELTTPYGESLAFRVKDGKVVERGGFGYAREVEIKNGVAIVSVYENNQQNKYVVRQNIETSEWELIDLDQYKDAKKEQIKKNAKSIINSLEELYENISKDNLLKAKQDLEFVKKLADECDEMNNPEVLDRSNIVNLEERIQKYENGIIEKKPLSGDEQLLVDLKKAKKDAETRLKNLPKEIKQRERYIRDLEVMLMSAMPEEEAQEIKDEIDNKKALLADIKSGMHERGLPKAINSYKERINELEGDSSKTTKVFKIEQKQETVRQVGVLDRNPAKTKDKKRDSYESKNENSAKKREDLKKVVPVSRKVEVLEPKKDLKKEKQEVTPDKINEEMETLQEQAMTAVDNFWESENDVETKVLPTIASKIKKDGLEKTIEKISVIEGILKYDGQILNVDNPKEMLEILKKVAPNKSKKSYGDLKVINYWENRATATGMLALNPDPQPWKDEIIRELAADVSLMPSNGKTLLFERIRKEPYLKVLKNGKTKESTQKVVRSFEVKRQDNGEYVITKSKMKGQIKGKYTKFRNEKVSLQDLLSIMNGTEIEESEE